MSDKKIALITGANRGIGFETARQLGRREIKVLLAARDAEKGEEAAETLKNEGLDVEFILLDVNDAETHEQAAKYIEENFGRLDILINNAGIFIDENENGAYKQASRTSLEVFRKTFDTNFFNVIALTQRLLPLVKKSEAGRIVFLSSILGSLTLHGDPEVLKVLANVKTCEQMPDGQYMVTAQPFGLGGDEKKAWLSIVSRTRRASMA